MSEEIKGTEINSDKNQRHKSGSFVSIFGIAVNFFLALIKFIAGMLSGSIAIMADSINNLSDAGSSVVRRVEERGDLANCSALDCSETGVLWLDYLNFRIKMPTTGDFDYIMNTLDTIFDEDGRVTREDSGTFDFTITEGKAYYSASS